MEGRRHRQGLRPAGAGPARGFAAFAALPAEVRCQVWQQAVLADHAERVVPVAHESWRVVPTRRLLAPSAVFAACAEARAEALGLYALALPLLPASRPGVFYPGGRRRERVPDVAETDQSTDEELWSDDGRPVFVGGGRRGLIRVSLDLDIFFLGHRHADWAPQHAPPVPGDAAARYTTRSLRRAERARIVRVMGTRLGWPYAAWAGPNGRGRGVGGGRRCNWEADARLRQTFVSVREVYYFVTFTFQSLPDVLRACRHAASMGHFCYMHSLPGYTQTLVSMRYLAPVGQEDAEAQVQDDDPTDIDD